MSLPVAGPSISGTDLQENTDSSPQHRTVSDDLFESFIRAITDPAKLQDLLIDSYRKCTSLESGSTNFSLQAKNLNESVDSQAVALRENLRQVYETISPDLCCSICTDMFIEPSVLDCGHTFCSPCINRWLDGETCCPNCRKSVFRPPKKHIEMTNFLEKIHTLLSPELQESRQAQITQREAEFATHERRRAILNVATPSYDIGLLTTEKYNFLRQNKEATIKVGAAMVRLAETIAETTPSGSPNPNIFPLKLNSLEKVMLTSIITMMTRIPGTRVPSRIEGGTARSRSPIGRNGTEQRASESAAPRDPRAGSSQSTSGTRRMSELLGYQPPNTRSHSQLDRIRRAERLRIMQNRVAEIRERNNLAGLRNASTTTTSASTNPSNPINPVDTAMDIASIYDPMSGWTLSNPDLTTDFRPSSWSIYDDPAYMNRIRAMISNSEPETPLAGGTGPEPILLDTDSE